MTFTLPPWAQGIGAVYTLPLLGPAAAGALAAPAAAAGAQSAANGAAQDLFTNGLGSMTATILIAILGLVLIAAGIWALVGDQTIEVVTTAAKAGAA